MIHVNPLLYLCTFAAIAIVSGSVAIVAKASIEKSSDEKKRKRYEKVFDAAFAVLLLAVTGLSIALHLFNTSEYNHEAQLTHVVVVPPNSSLSVAFVAYAHDNATNRFPYAVLAVENSDMAMHEAYVQVTVYSKKETIAHGELFTADIPPCNHKLVKVPLTWRPGYTADDITNITIILKQID